MAGFVAARWIDRRSSGLSGPGSASCRLCFLECEADFLHDIRREGTSLCILNIPLGVFGTGGADDGAVDAFDAEREPQSNLRPDFFAFAFESQLFNF